MPCYEPRHHGCGDFDRHSEELRETKDTLARTEALLCAVLRNMDPHELRMQASTIVWEDVGVTREWYLKWWEEHQRIDSNKENAK